MRRPIGKHIDNRELDALVTSSSETGYERHELSPDAMREVRRHVGLCVDCSGKVSKYWQLVSRFSNVAVSKVAQPGPECPRDQDVDWHEVAAGLLPELKAAQLILHAALCDHCGPRLRAVTSVQANANPQEEKLLAELKAPSRPNSVPRPVRRPQTGQFMRWLVPALGLMLIVGVFHTMRSSSSVPLSGPEFAEFAVRTHRQHAEGRLALDVHSDSQQTLNEWLKANSKFAVALPSSPAVPGEVPPYRLDGARLMQVGGKTAAFVAYQDPTTPLPASAVSLVVTPDSVAKASGGTKVDFKKVTFHYATVEGYKVVTWSIHGLTYALVSQEGNRTQRSCMVCHSSMRDRDLSHTPTPLSQRPPNTL